MKTKLCAPYEKWELMELKDGCIYKVKKLKGVYWFELGEAPKQNLNKIGDQQYYTMSTTDSERLGLQRRIPDKEELNHVQ